MKKITTFLAATCMLLAALLLRFNSPMPAMANDSEHYCGEVKLNNITTINEDEDNEIEYYYYDFIPEKDGVYIIKSLVEDTSMKTWTWVYSDYNGSNAKELASGFFNYTYKNNNNNFYCFCEMKAGETYTFCICTEGRGSYDFIVQEAKVKNMGRIKDGYSGTLTFSDENEIIVFDDEDSENGSYILKGDKPVKFAYKQKNDKISKMDLDKEKYGYLNLVRDIKYYFYLATEGSADISFHKAKTVDRGKLKFGVNEYSANAIYEQQHFTYTVPESGIYYLDFDSNIMYYDIKINGEPDENKYESIKYLEKSDKLDLTLKLATLDAKYTIDFKKYNDVNLGKIDTTTSISVKDYDIDTNYNVTFTPKKDGVYLIYMFNNEGVICSNNYLSDEGGKLLCICNYNKYDVTNGSGWEKKGCTRKLYAGKTYTFSTLSKDGNGTKYPFELRVEDISETHKEHDYRYIGGEKPTCTKDGYEEYVCSFCGEKKVEKISAKGHKWEEVYIYKAPTYDKTGTGRCYCMNINCYEYKTVVIPKLKKTKLTSENTKITGIADRVYNGKERGQNPVVKYGKVTLKKGKDYTISYKNNKNVGTATVIITGKEKYSGKITKTFVIKPKTTSVKKLMASKKTIKVDWNKLTAQAGGYQIQYSTDKNYKLGNRIVTVNKNTTVTAKLNNLKAGKRYYVRIRTFKKVGNKTYYSAWSNSKSVVTKK